MAGIGKHGAGQVHDLAWAALIHGRDAETVSVATVLSGIVAVVVGGLLGAVLVVLREGVAFLHRFLLHSKGAVGVRCGWLGLVVTQEPAHGGMRHQYVLQPLSFLLELIHLGLEASLLPLQILGLILKLVGQLSPSVATLGSSHLVSLSPQPPLFLFIWVELIMTMSTSSVCAADCTDNPLARVPQMFGTAPVQRVIGVRTQA